MGTLTDITARAGNTMKRQSYSSTGYQSLDSPESTKKSAEKENSAKSRSPHFMTPTFSSSSQSVTANSVTPVPSTKSSKAESSKAESNNAWMKSAAKRVGFRRTGDGTPRSKKEGPPKSSKTIITFPDKLATPSASRVSDTPPSMKMQPQKDLSANKPLPKPPKGQTFNPAEFDEPKTLIDASDKPLRRRSPPGTAVHEEDWPVLFPKRPTSPGTLQEMLRDTGSQLAQQAQPAQQERYPILGNTLSQVTDEEQLPVSRYSATYKIPRKEMSSPDLDKASNIADKDTITEKSGIDDPFKEGVYDSGPILPKSPGTTTESPSKLSAGAAAVEKLAQESRPTIEPRQTRTSSLRARLSAGQLIRDSQNKVVGFTDFTANSESALGVTKADNLRANKDARVQRSLSPSAKANPRPLRTKTSRESIGGNRAPAQFVAGSRRPTHPRRPSSRGSLRNELREPTPPLSIASSSQSVPSRSAPAVPRSENTQHGKPSGKTATEVPTSKSSIPVPRQMMSDLPRHFTGTAGPTTPKEVTISEVKDEAYGEFKSFEGDPSSDVVNKLDQTLSDPSPNAVMDSKDSHIITPPTKALIDNYGAHVLEAIEESPQHAYKLKRLSTASPEFGPTLKISPSAERIIMGPATDKEKPRLTKKKSEELNRATMKLDQKDRPSSSQGLSRSESRFGLNGIKIREKKVKSADLGKLSPAIEHLLNGSHNLSPQPKHESKSASATRGSSISTSFNDPFFDARSQLQPSPEKSDDGNGQETTAPTEESRNPSLGENTRGLSSDLLGNSEKLSPNSHIESVIRVDYKLSGRGSGPFQGKDVAAKDLAAEPKDEAYSKHTLTETGTRTDSIPLDGANPFGDTVNAAEDTAQEAEDKDENGSVIFLPSTPEQRPLKDNASSGSHPPRSSSRMAHPNYTTAKNSPVSPLSAETRPATPLKDTPQDFARRQNNLGSVRGHGTSQLDLSNPASKRDSAAHESHKSQASASKGSLSIFRGLFHKRSSENEPLKSTKKIKSKPTTNPSSGSPFPPISEVHPIHRPALASLARSAASTPRPIATTTTVTRPTTPATPAPASPETSLSTNLAMELLDLSRKERSSPRKEKLLQLGSIMVEGITQARNAEKAMEEAKQAARRAEVAHALCRKSLKEVTRFVEVWRDSI